MPASPTWHLRGRDLDQPGLTEPELRHALLKLDTDLLAEFKVRHGRGAWNSADKVMDLFRLLARHGCYICSGRKVEGPFTAERAMELIKEKLVTVRKQNPQERIRVRVGRSSNWISPDQFVSQYRSPSPRNGSPVAIPPSVTAPPKLADAVFESTPIFQSHVDEIFGDVVLGASIPITVTPAPPKEQACDKGTVRQEAVPDRDARLKERDIQNVDDACLGVEVERESCRLAVEESPPPKTTRVLAPDLPTADLPYS